MIKRVLVLGDERKGSLHSRIEELCRWLSGRGVEHEVELDRESSLEQREADLVVVFGGDGSLLAAGRRMGHNQMPTLGINLGRLGFLTAFRDADVIEGVELALAGSLHEEPVLMLACEVERPDGTRGEPVLCLNDA